MRTQSNKKLESRLNRIAGQVAGIQRMVDEDRYCVDILTQIAAVRAALDTLGVELLTRHVETCVMAHGTDSGHPKSHPMSQEEIVSELRATLSRFLK